MDKLILKENKELNKEMGNKEPYEVMLFLENIKSVWDGNASLSLSESGVPILEGWYKERENSEKRNIEYMYIDNEWKLIQKYMLNLVDKPNI